VSDLYFHAHTLVRRTSGKNIVTANFLGWLKHASFALSQARNRLVLADLGPKRRSWL
jgi:hypothetical protein